jgi:hypothetical protein
MGYDLPTGKEEIFLIPKRTNACTLTEEESTTIISNSIGQGEVDDSNSTSQYDGNSC